MNVILNVSSNENTSKYIDKKCRFVPRFYQIRFFGTEKNTTKIYFSLKIHARVDVHMFVLHTNVYICEPMIFF
jgi:hypothetical protein